MKVTGPLGKVIGITDDWKIVEQKVANNGTTTYYIRFIGRTVCPECGRPCPKKDSVEVSWSARDMCGFPVIISGKVPRARCPEHGIRTIDVAFASNIARVTGSLERKVAFESMRSTFTSVASKYHLNTNTVIRIATHWARKLEDELDLSHTTSFLIDEKSYKSGHRHITFIVDPGSGATLFGTEGRSCDTQSMINAARGYRNPANLISLVYLRSMWKHPSLCRYNPYSTII